MARSKKPFFINEETNMWSFIPKIRNSMKCFVAYYGVTMILIPLVVIIFVETKYQHDLIPALVMWSIIWLLETAIAVLLSLRIFSPIFFGLKGRQLGYH